MGCYVQMEKLLNIKLAEKYSLNNLNLKMSVFTMVSGFIILDSEKIIGAPELGQNVVWKPLDINAAIFLNYYQKSKKFMQPLIILARFVFIFIFVYNHPITANNEILSDKKKGIKICEIFFYCNFLVFNCFASFCCVFIFVLLCLFCCCCSWDVV